MLQPGPPACQPSLCILVGQLPTLGPLLPPAPSRPAWSAGGRIWARISRGGPTSQSEGSPSLLPRPSSCTGAFSNRPPPAHLPHLGLCFSEDSMDTAGTDGECHKQPSVYCLEAKAQRSGGAPHTCPGQAAANRSFVGWCRLLWLPLSTREGASFPDGGSSPWQPDALTGRKKT